MKPVEVRIAPVDRRGHPIDFALVLDGGQTFRWWVLGDGCFEGMAGAYPIRLVVDPSLAPGEMRGEGPAGRNGEGTGAGPDPGGLAAPLAALAELLDLARDYGALQRRLIERDPLLAPAVAATRGLRIVRLSPWEALLSFWLSSHTHIPRIKRMLARLCEAAGADPEILALPAPGRLAEMGEAALRRLGLGYRAAYVAKGARRLADDPAFLARGHELPTPELLAHLQELPGVGEKVAHCVALFGYGRWDAFPIDRWARRALEAVYFGGRPVPLGRLRAFVQDRFGELAGLAQAHLFAYARLQGRAARRKRPEAAASGHAKAGKGWLREAGEARRGASGGV